jgi:hypothetical protein
MSKSLKYKKYITNIEEYPLKAHILLGLVNQVFSIDESLKWKKASSKDVIILTIENDIKSGLLENGLYICSFNDFYNIPFWILKIKRFLVRIEIKLSILLNEKKYSKLKDYGNQNAISSIYNGFLLKNILKKLNPNKIIAQQVLRYGFVATIYKKCPVYTRPYGQDIFIYGFASFFLNKIIHNILKNSKGIILFSTYSKHFINENYKISNNKLFVFDVIPDQDVFKNKEYYDINSIKKYYNINYDSFVIFNLRRFQDGWGASVITDSFIELAKKSDKFKFILILESVNKKNEIYLKKIRSENLMNSFLIFYKSITKEIYRDLLVISDLGVSIMEKGDMRSESILNAASVGLPIVMNESEEFKLLKSSGFNAQFIKKIDSLELTEQINYLSKNSLILNQLSNDNNNYIKKLNIKNLNFEKYLASI